MRRFPGDKSTVFTKESKRHSVVMNHDLNHFLCQWLFKIGASRTAIAVKALGIWILTKKGGVLRDIKGAVYFYQILKLARIERLAEIDAEDLIVIKLETYLSARGKLLH